MNADYDGTSKHWQSIVLSIEEKEAFERDGDIDDRGTRKQHQKQDDAGPWPWWVWVLIGYILTRICLVLFLK